MLKPEEFARAFASPYPAAVCTVVETSGSTPRKAGAAMVVIADGSPLGDVIGTVGGGAVEHEVRRRALDAIAKRTPQLFHVALTTQLGMCCGGSMRFFLEPLDSRPDLVIFGAGHCGEALARAAAAVDFRVTVVDGREALLQPERFWGATLVHDEDVDTTTQPLHTGTFAVVTTHDHALDQRIVEQLLPLGLRYLALMGSQRKAALTRERLTTRGFVAEQIATLRCPAGVDIRAETPGEIAVSILAEIISILRTTTSP